MPRSARAYRARRLPHCGTTDGRIFQPSVRQARSSVSVAGLSVTRPDSNRVASPVSAGNAKWPGATVRRWPSLTVAATSHGVLVSHLTADDRFSAVAFDSNVQVIVPPGPMGTRDSTNALLGRIVAGTMTNLSGGWLLGASHVEAARADGQVNRVLLLTDGQANEGVTEPERLLGIARGLVARDVHTTCIGFGAGFNEDLLKGLADAGGGNFHFIDSPEQARSVFARELQELLQVAAQNLRLKVAPSRDVRFVEILQEYPTHPIEGGLEIELGDLLSGEDKPLLLHFAIPRSLAGRHGISMLTLSFQQVLGEVAFRELNAFVETPDRGADSLAINPVVWREVLLSQSAREMKNAMADADKGQLDSARARLLDARKELERSPHAYDPDYVERRHELDRLAGMLRSPEDYHSHGRKSLSHSSVSFSRSRSFTSGGVLPPPLRIRLATAERLVFVTGPGLLKRGSLPTEFEGRPVAEIERPAADGAAQARQWRWARERLRHAAPTAAHEAIARMAQGGRWGAVEVATSAIDGLHRRAGSAAVFEIYGNLGRGRCPADGRLRDPIDEDAPRCACGRLLRPDVVWDGGAVPEAVWDEARLAVAGAPAVIVAGTLARTTPMRRLLEGLQGVVLGIAPPGAPRADWATEWLEMEPAAAIAAIEPEITWY